MSVERYPQSSQAPTRLYTPPLSGAEQDFHQRLLNEVRETYRSVGNVLERLSYVERLLQDYVAPASVYPPPLERGASYGLRNEVATSYVHPAYAPRSPNPRDLLPEHSRYLTNVLPESRPGYSVHAHRRDPMGPEEYRQSFSDWRHPSYTERVHHRPRSPLVEPLRQTSDPVYGTSPQHREGAWRRERSPYEERTHRQHGDGGEDAFDLPDVTRRSSRPYVQEQERFHSRDDPRPEGSFLVPRVGPTPVPLLMPAPRKRQRSVDEAERDHNRGNVESSKRRRGQSKHTDVHLWLQEVDAGTLSPTYRPESPLPAPAPAPPSPPRIDETQLHEAPEWTRKDEDGPLTLPPLRQTSPVHDSILYIPVSRSVVLPPSLAYKEELRRSRVVPDEGPSSSGHTTWDSPSDLQWVGVEER
ncbi:uncharacterized protein BT62DRAFT_1008073 [Guyanagaster necrorhizus]|uniref:Uncharacterized protein n=1 Tax=Guyanagaster necrorhizus TaxID=856835 RepID=A0A9P7VPI1_9AGAR|nr:uncharacterized protein BT62DRAFT_1008073 [Guyanagaster necrorhizus MCA 3950]KAG7444407.1 hypothetical protein BT62DRAFT_1008073 [Guyanagaster necrorhizus MCA 3950]